MSEWRRNLRGGSTTVSRTVLQRILKGRIVFSPRAEGDGYDFEAPTRFDKLFAGIVIARADAEAGQLRGLEHLTHEDTFDADYGRLLENAIGRKFWCALQDSNLRPPGS